ncbi:uncharacterized protein LOC144589121 [Pogona vitticeps]
MHRTRGAGGAGLSWRHPLPESFHRCFPDLSRSIQDCNLGTSTPPARADHAGCQRHCQGCKYSAHSHVSLPKGHRGVPPCPHTRSRTRLGIERSSIFDCNAVEKLDAFFSEKLKGWGRNAVPLPDSCETTEAPPEATRDHSRAQNNTGKGEAAAEGKGRKQKPGWATHGRGKRGAEPAWHSPENDSPVVLHNPHLRHLQPNTAGRGEHSGGLLSKHRPSPAVYGSARILPQCRISHVQRCTACQAFNRDLPAPYGNCWAPRKEEGQGGASAPHRVPRTGPSSLHPVSDRLSKVQQWLEQTLADAPPGHPRPQPHGAWGSPDLKEGARWGRAKDAGDWRGQEPPAESRHRRKSPPEEPQPAARILACDERSTSPATCSCLYCEQQRPRARLVSGKMRADPSAEEVAVQLQAENRIPRIVEAFERRSSRAQQDRAFGSARPREPEKRGRSKKTHGDARQGRWASSTTAQKSSSEQGLHESPRTRDHRGMEGQRLQKQPSFLDRLRGLH